MKLLPIKMEIQADSDRMLNELRVAKGLRSFVTKKIKAVWTTLKRAIVKVFKTKIKKVELFDTVEITIPAQVKEDIMKDMNMLTESQSGAIGAIKGNYNEALVCQFLFDHNGAEVDISSSYEKYRGGISQTVSSWDKKLKAADIKNYTKKQWDLYPEELDKSVLQRIPIRYDSNPYYFNDKYQGLPKEGYTCMVRKMINRKNIKIVLDTNHKEFIKTVNFDKLIVTSPIDEFFDYSFGKLRYRAVKFIFETYSQNSYQKNSVINFPNDKKYTRITEFKKLTLQKTPKTTICKEIPTWDGEKTYPVPSEIDNQILSQYQEHAKKLDNVYFLGRLGQYKYINMDQAVNNALELYETLKNIH